MADPVQAVAEVVGVGQRSFPSKKNPGETVVVHQITLKSEKGSLTAETFSDTMEKAAKEKQGQQVKVEVEQTQYGWNLLRMWTADGKTEVGASQRTGGGGGKKGFGHPEWSYETAEERKAKNEEFRRRAIEERASIQRQTAGNISERLTLQAVQYSSADQAVDPLDYFEQAYARVLPLIDGSKAPAAGGRENGRSPDESSAGPLARESDSAPADSLPSSSGTSSVPPQPPDTPSESGAPL